MSEQPQPPLTTTTSLKPAAVVLGIASLVLIFFTTINIVANPTVNSTTTIPIVVGALPVDKASTLLQECQLPENPPLDISSALLVPTNTVAASGITWRGKGPGGFDCARSLTAAAPSGELFSFYKSHLTVRGWKVFSQGANYHSQKPQILFQKAGSDTFYWIFGVSVDHSDAHSTSYTVRLYQGAGLI
ncbi:unannotated protein [freshwater metagenome]|uniref:Unannotated protein n=1 Tax=freshwater metagenome TaxID=449393 RepID=A0A6J7DPA0_9ZZZZ|nr:hypothetical protein [Actinomycetota bacterium]MUH58383.1 hypothetical protein [Actinomycetota bacterium]